MSDRTRVPLLAQRSREPRPRFRPRGPVLTRDLGSVPLFFHLLRRGCVSSRAGFDSPLARCAAENDFRRLVARVPSRGPGPFRPAGLPITPALPHLCAPVWTMPQGESRGRRTRRHVRWRSCTSTAVVHPSGRDRKGQPPTFPGATPRSSNLGGARRPLVSSRPSVARTTREERGPIDLALFHARRLAA